MTSKEAAERLRPIFGRDKGMTTHEYQTAATWAALYHVAAAYLAEHPADEDEPVTEEWMRAAGFDVFGGRGTITYPHEKESTLRIEVDAIADGPSVWLEGWHCDIKLPDLKTRGQVRRLLSALGITLKEGT